MPQSNPIDKFGYVLGQNGIIALELEANPRPHLEWNIRDQTIKEGGHDSTGRIKADEIRDLVSYNLTVVVLHSGSKGICFFYYGGFLLYY